MAERGRRESLVNLLPECPICFGIMRGARLLDCGHTYCQDCLEREVLRGPAPHRLLACFECRAEMALGPDGVSGLKRNFSIQTIIDKFDNMRVSQEESLEQEDTEAAPTEEKHTVKCEQHTNEVAYFICDTCHETLICRLCTEGHHFGHHFVSVKGKSEILKASLMELIKEHQDLTAQVIERDQRQAVDSITSNMQRLENEVVQTAAKKISAIQKQRDKLIGIVQHVGQVMEEKTNNMYYNEKPIDSIAEMVVGDNEYEITAGYAEAKSHLQQSLAEMKEKMSSRIMPSIAKCLSFKEEGNGVTDARLCDLILSNTCWKPATTYVDIKAMGKIVAFSYGPFGDWCILTSIEHSAQESEKERLVSLRHLSSNGQCKKMKMLYLKAMPLDIVFAKSGKLCILGLCNNQLCLATAKDLSKRSTVMKPLPVKDLVHDTLKVTVNPQDQMCVPDKNGCGIWKISVNSEKQEKFSMGEFPHPMNAVSCGTGIFCITADKKIVQRQEFPGSVPTLCSHDIKSGDPVQLLVDPKTCTLLVVHQSVNGASAFELSIHQLGKVKPIADPVKLSWVPTVMKADITQTGDLTILLAKEQSGMLVEYKREDLPSLYDIPGLLPPDQE
nr:E3 ubiquitin-protein ligase TRIM13-like [Lytechinus pictus]